MESQQMAVREKLFLWGSTSPKFSKVLVARSRRLRQDKTRAEGRPRRTQQYDEEFDQAQRSNEG